MGDIIKMVVVLTIISCSSALLVSFTNSKTEEKINSLQKQAQTEALKQIMPEGVNILESKCILPSKDTLSYWSGISETDTFYAFKIQNRGYSSIISFLVCVDKNGIIKGMTVMDQSETPGLGSRTQEVISNKYIWSPFSKEEKKGTWFSEQFKGLSVLKPITIEKSMGEWHSLSEDKKRVLSEKNSVTAITGSTISTRAVTEGINQKAKEYLKAIRG